jgi:hypothetical protein
MKGAIIRCSERRLKTVTPLGPVRNIVGFTGGDLTCRPEFYARCSELIKTHTRLWGLIETNGYGLTPGSLDRLQGGGVDAFWLDSKSYRDEVHRWLTGCSNEWILKLPEEMLKRDFTVKVIPLYIPELAETGSTGGRCGTSGAGEQGDPLHYPGLLSRVQNEKLPVSETGGREFHSRFAGSRKSQEKMGECMWRSSRTLSPRDTLGCDTPWHVTRFYPYDHLSHLPPTPIGMLEKGRQIGLEAGPGSSTWETFQDTREKIPIAPPPKASYPPSPSCNLRISFAGRPVSLVEYSPSRKILTGARLSCSPFPFSILVPLRSGSMPPLSP